MKKRIAIFTAVLAMCGIVMSSYDNGAASSGQICCGAKDNVTTCSGSTGTGCHGTGSGTDCYILVKNAAHQTGIGSYIPGNSYWIIIGGENNLHRPKFGFQFTAVKGIGTGETLAGSYSNFPLYVSSNIYSGLRFVEQTQGINAAVAGTYLDSFMWVAPAVSGSGIIKMYLTLLAVNGNNFQDADDVSGNVSITLFEGTAGVAGMLEHANAFNAYPNPVHNTLSLQAMQGISGQYMMTVYDLAGRQIMQQEQEVNSSLMPVLINTATWQPGMYNVVLAKDGMYTRIPVVKQ